MKVDPARLVGVCTVAGVAVLIILFIISWLSDAPVHLPSGDSSRGLLGGLAPDDRRAWALNNALYGIFFLLLLPGLWVAYQRLREDSPTLAAAGVALGIAAVLMESASRWWHVIVDLPVVDAFYATQDPGGQSALLSLAGSYDSVHHALHYSSFVVAGWAVLFLLVLLQHKTFPLWFGFLAFALVLGLGDYPLLTLAWAVPAALVLSGGAAKGLASPVRGARRQSARTPVAARGRR
ncbi:MAG: hypothetical protein EXR48_04045 [Dehalococcoidia bacterium]|nr:hypothetical protein [Dehalococcoidia bacterium]